MAKTNEELIADLVPAFQPIAKTLLQRAKTELGLDLRITEGYRTLEQQAIFYAQGRTTPGKIITYAKPGESLHNQRRAFDVVERTKLYNIDWTKLGELGESLGLTWGGRFPVLVDRPHFEYHGPETEPVVMPSIAVGGSTEPIPAFRTHPTQESWFKEIYGFLSGLVKPGFTAEDVNYAYHGIYKAKYADRNIEDVLLDIAREQYRDELGGLGQKYEQITTTLYRKVG